MPQLTIEQQLETMAKNEAEATGVSFAKAYDEILKMPEGAALYAQLDKAEKTHAPARPEVLKGDKRSTAEKALESLAKAHAAEHGTTFAKGYAAVLETPRGRELYAETAA